VNHLVRRFEELAVSRLAVANLIADNEDDPFRIAIQCHFPAIGRIDVEPFADRHFAAFRRFYDGQHPDWGLSKQSRSFFDEHPTDTDTLTEIAHRVASRQDARFAVLTSDHIVGYMLIEEIDCINAGRETFWGEDYYAMIGIGVSDRFHGTGLASLGMLFLKLVAAMSDVGLGLTRHPDNKRACGFYEKHGFVQRGYRDIFVPHTGTRSASPWYVLRTNEIAQSQ
jgi:ribosomal protein S18 acetylase RimI-like enzyme